MYNHIWGWFNNSQQTVYDIFAEQAENGDNILEIGALLGIYINLLLFYLIIYIGKSTCYLAEQLKLKGKTNVKIYVVDPWLTDTCTSSSRYKQEIREKYGNDLFPHFQKALIDAGCWDMIVPMQMTSDEAFLKLQKQNITFKFTFIDGDHSYMQCLKDIQNFQQITTDIIAGDDYKGGGGVKQAVKQIYNNYELIGDPLYPAWLVKNLLNK